MQFDGTGGDSDDEYDYGGQQLQPLERFLKDEPVRNEHVQNGDVADEGYEA